jgi:ubiquinone/menaquinone biosynthesis C-methylase UbiE
MARQREAQLAYSELMDKMLDEDHRRQKARKISQVLLHFLGRTDFTDLVVVDVGCSAGYIADSIAEQGGRTLGIDIDVPGLAKAHARFGEQVGFLCANGEQLPFPDGSVDVVVFNHIYEHVVDPVAVLRDITRVLKPNGAVYLGLGNRLGIMEPHYRLPFLSYLPPALADRYVRAFGRADSYYERFRTRPGLRKLVHGLRVWDYSLSILVEPERFAAEDMVPPKLRKTPAAVWKAGMPLLPTYIWVGSPAASGPAGPQLSVPPTPVVTRAG